MFIEIHYHDFGLLGHRNSQNCSTSLIQKKKDMQHEGSPKRLVIDRTQAGTGNWNSNTNNVAEGREKVAGIYMG